LRGGKLGVDLFAVSQELGALRGFGSDLPDQLDALMRAIGCQAGRQGGPDKLSHLIRHRHADVHIGSRIVVPVVTLAGGRVAYIIPELPLFGAVGFVRIDHRHISGKLRVLRPVCHGQLGLFDQGVIPDHAACRDDDGEPRDAKPVFFTADVIDESRHVLFVLRVQPTVLVIPSLMPAQTRDLETLAFIIRKEFLSIFRHLCNEL